MKFQNHFKLTEACSQDESLEISEIFSEEIETVWYDNFLYVYRASYDTSAPNAKRKYPDEGEADEEEIEEYKVRRNNFFSLVFMASWGTYKMCVCAHVKITGMCVDTLKIFMRTEVVISHTLSYLKSHGNRWSP